MAFTELLKGLLKWTKDHPLKFSGGFVAAATTLVVAFGQGWLQHIFFPSLKPLNVRTTVVTRNPTKNLKPYKTPNGATYRPLELTVTVDNPGLSKLYLLKTVWVAEVCSVQDLGIGEDSRKLITPKQKEEIETKFSDSISVGNLTNNHNQTYKGFERVCEFIGTGRLLTDQSISPAEQLNAQLIILYPVNVNVPPGGPEASMPVDFIKITTFIPSSTKKDDSIRSALGLSPQKPGDPTVAPYGIQIWGKVKEGEGEGEADTCSQEGVGEASQLTAQQQLVRKVRLWLWPWNTSIAAPTEDEQELSKKPDPSEEYWQTPAAHQLLCPLQQTDKRVERTSMTRSITEAWLQDRTD